MICMVAKTKKELEQMILKDIKKAMQDTAKAALSDMKYQINDYYAGSNPKQYVRTYHLKKTPKVSKPESNGKLVQIKAYLDKNYDYTTGKQPSMTDVLELTNYHINWSSVGWLRNSIGKMGYWERAKEDIQKDFSKSLQKYFAKTK